MYITTYKKEAIKIAKEKKNSFTFSNQKTMIISLVFVLVALVVAFNFEKFTGQAAKNVQPTKIYISSDPDIVDLGSVTVSPGDDVYVTVDAGSKGSYGTVYIYDVNTARQKRVVSRELTNCGPTMCRSGVIGTAKIDVYSNWKGKYCATVQDLATKKNIQSCFTVM